MTVFRYILPNNNILFVFYFYSKQQLKYLTKCGFDI